MPWNTQTGFAIVQQHQKLIAHFTMHSFLASEKMHKWNMALRYKKLIWFCFLICSSGSNHDKMGVKASLKKVFLYAYFFKQNFSNYHCSNFCSLPILIQVLFTPNNLFWRDGDRDEEFNSIFKVGTFWKGHKNLKQSPTWFDMY